MRDGVTRVGVHAWVQQRREKRESTTSFRIAREKREKEVERRDHYRLISDVLLSDTSSQNTTKEKENETTP